MSNNNYNDNYNDCSNSSKNLSLIHIYSEYNWCGTFDRNVFLVEGPSGLKYRCGQYGALLLGLDVYKRQIMHFIENHALRVLVQKSDWVVFGKAPHVEVLQRVVRQVWEQITDQMCIRDSSAVRAAANAASPVFRRRNR